MENKKDDKAISVLAAGHFTSDLYGGFITPILPFIAQSLAISLDFVGLILSIAHISASIFQPVYGYLADFISRRFFVFWGTIMAAFFISLTGIVDNVYLLIAVIFFGSMGVGMFHPQATAFAGYFSKKNINRRMGLFMASGTAGFASGPFLSSVLVEKFGLTSTVWAIIPGLLVALLIYKYLPKIKIKSKRTSVKDTFKMLGGIKSKLFPLIMISVCRALIVMSIGNYMPFLWKENNYPVIMNGVLICIFSLLGGMSSYLGGQLADKIDNKKILYWSFIPVIPCLIGSLYFLDSVPFLSFAFYLLVGFIIMLAFPLNIIIAQKAAPENTATVSGIIGGFSWGIAGLMLYPIGVLSSIYGISTVLMFIALVPLISIVAIKYLKLTA